MKNIYNFKIEKKYLKEAKKFDKKANENIQLGLISNHNGLQEFRLWHPSASKVHMLIFDLKSEKLIEQKVLKNNKSIWSTPIENKYEGCLYQIKIFYKNNDFTIALDPYAYAVKPFNWNGKTDYTPKGFLINLNDDRCGKKPQDLINTKNLKPLIYELNIRDFSSGFDQKKCKEKLGTFNCALEKNIFEYLKFLNINTLQILPINFIYSLNSLDQKILNKNQATGWTTNYNWGYDPLNFFSLENFYSSDPNDPYKVIFEFRNFVNESHKNNIAIIVDVVYNHCMDHKIFNDYVPNYFFRKSSPINPVNQPAFATERKMVRKLFLDVLVHMLNFYNVDGFRFDLSCFFDKKFLNKICKTLKSIKPNIILHGEAWPFTDLKFKQSWIIGHSNNKKGFAYFNDLTRNALKGNEEIKKIDFGLIKNQNTSCVSDYVTSIFGNLKALKNNKYFCSMFGKNQWNSGCFFNSFDINLQYAACHDGFTLWDKVNLASNENFETKILIYKQILMAQLFLPGKQLILAGTELCQSKPFDKTGDDWKKHYSGFEKTDYFGYQPDLNAYSNNSYKTSDYVNKIKWQNLKNSVVYNEVFLWFKKLTEICFCQKIFYFKNKKKLLQNIKFLVCDPKGFLIYKLKKEYLIIHNFTDQEYKYNLKNYELIFSNRKINDYQIIKPRTSLLMKERK